MSRPRRSEHIREALIQTGIEQISTHGYHGTGIKQILDTVNVPKGSFYNFFASKELFVAEVIATYSQDLLKQLNDFISGSGQGLSAKEQLQSIYEFSLHKSAKSEFKQACLIGAMSSEIASESLECREQLKIATQNWVAFFVDRIQQGQLVGEFRNDVTAEELGSVYWAAWEGALIKMKMQNSVESAKKTMNLMLNVLMTPAK